MKSKDKLIKAVSTYANRKGISVDAAVSELNKMSKEEINNIFNKMKLFKDGGKLDYLLCLKKGGHVKDCGCGGKVDRKAEGGDIRDEIKWKKPTINGSDTTSVGYNPLGQKFVAKGTKNGRSLQRITSTGGSGQPQITNWKQNLNLWDMITGVNQMSADQYVMLNPVLKQQEGGELSRDDMFKNAADNRRMSKRQARKAYRNAKYSLRMYGPENLRGSELRQAARHAFDLNEPIVNLPDIVIDENVPVINDQITFEAKPLTANYNFNGFSFNKAFGDARKLGLKIFNWRGADYTTELAKPDGKNKSY